MHLLTFTIRAARLAVRRPVDATPRAPADPARAREYARARERVFLAGLALSWLTSLTLLILRAGPRVEARAAMMSRSGVSRDTLAVVALGAITTAISFPLRYYGGYRLEHRYGLSNHTHGSWATDQIKALLLQAGFGLALIHGLYWTIRRWPDRWWLVVSGVSIPLTIVLAQLFPVLIAPLFNRYEPLQDRDLAERLKRLAARSGIEVAEVLQVDLSRQTRKANAFFTGIGRTKRIVLADTLIDEFTSEEIEVVVAHEIAHQAHGDIWRLIAVGSAMNLALTWGLSQLANLATRRAGAATGIDDLGHVSSLPLLGLIGSVLGTVFGPLQNAWSRSIERQADQFALDLTGDPVAFESAMRRLADLNLAEIDPPWLSRTLLYSHPPISERIEHARRHAREHQVGE